MAPTNTIQTWDRHLWTAEEGGGRQGIDVGGRPEGLVVADRWPVLVEDPGPWERFDIVKLGDNRVGIQSWNGAWLCAEGGGGGLVVANRTDRGPWETFVVERQNDGWIALRAHNGQYLCAEGGGGSAIVANRNTVGPWECFRGDFLAAVEPIDPVPVGDVRDIRGIFALGQDLFPFMRCGRNDEADWRALCRQCQDRGDNTIQIGLNSNGYGVDPAFDHWGTPLIAVGQAVIAQEYGLVPTWVLHDDSSLAVGDGGRAKVYRRHWEGVAPVIRPFVKRVVPAFEWNDHLTPAEQWELLLLLQDLFPDAYRLVSFTDDRWAIAPKAQSHHPDGPLPAAIRGGEYDFWTACRQYGKHGQPVVHGLALQAAMDQVDDPRSGHKALRARMAEFVLRLNGTRQPDFPDAERDFDQKFGGQPAGNFDVHFWEGGGEWVIKGYRSVAWADSAGADVLNYLPGVRGAGDGWRGAKPVKPGRPRFDSFPTDILADIRTDMDAGPFYGVTEAPGRPDAVQDEYIRLAVDRGYRWLVTNVGSGAIDKAGSEQWPREWPAAWRSMAAYNGFTDPAGIAMLERWVRKVAEARIVNILAVGTQGAPLSWDLMTQTPIPCDHGPDVHPRKGFTNEWFRAHGREQTDRWIGWTGGKVLAAAAWEMDKLYGPRNGPLDFWGWNGLQAFIGEGLKAVPLIAHYLPRTFGPDGDIGGRTWDPVAYYRGANVDRNAAWIRGVCLQFPLDESVGEDDYRRTIRTVKGKLAPLGIRVYGWEYVRPGQGHLDSLAANEAKAQRIGRVLVEAGADGVGNGYR